MFCCTVKRNLKTWLSPALLSRSSRCLFPPVVYTCIILNGLLGPELLKSIAVTSSTHRCHQIIPIWNLKYNLSGQQSSLFKRGGLLIHYHIIHLLPPPVLLFHSSPRTVVRLVALHILACHLVSPAWHCRGPHILSYSYSTSILFPLLFYSAAQALLHFFIYFYRRGRLANGPPSPNRRLFQLSYQV